MNETRRHFLRDATALLSSSFVPHSGVAQANKGRLILLGVGGGPRPRKTNSAPAQVIVVNDAAQQMTLHFLEMNSPPQGSLF